MDEEYLGCKPVKMDGVEDSVFYTRRNTEPSLCILKDPKGLAKVLCINPSGSEHEWTNYEVIQYLAAALMTELDAVDPLWRHSSLYSLAVNHLNLNVPDLSE